MRQLLAYQLESARPLIPPAGTAGHTAFGHAVVDGTLPGRVFVDRPAARSAIICPDCGFLLAVGKPDRDLADQVVAELSRDWLERTCESRTLVATSPGWSGALDSLLPASGERLEFAFTGAPRSAPPQIPPEVALKRLDLRSARLFGRGIDPWVVRTWGGPEGFALRSFGWVALGPDGVLAACVACAVGAGEAEIEIGTHPGHRRRGLATHAGLAFIADCAARGLTPAWTCDATNRASISTAAALGFEPVRKVRTYSLDPRLVRTAASWQLEGS